MSLNNTHSSSGVILFQGEFIILYCDGVTITFESDNPVLKGSAKGRIYLTTHRMIFRSNDSSKKLQSFSFPFYTIFNLALEQPIFGANYIKGTVKAEPSGGWSGEAVFSLTFKNGGAIEFAQAASRAATLVTSQANGRQPPPPYTPPCAGTYGPYAANYMAPPGPAPYGFQVPQSQYFYSPPADQVYMAEQPPPYPGVMGFNPNHQQQTAYMRSDGMTYAPPPNPYAAPPQPYGAPPQQPGWGPPPAYAPSAPGDAKSKKFD